MPIVNHERDARPDLRNLGCEERQTPNGTGSTSQMCPGSFAFVPAQHWLSWQHKTPATVFPEIAANALLAADLPAKIDTWDPIRWVHVTTDFTRQMDPQASFGDPPITLFVGPRFYIDVYYWLDSTTAIHEHGFSGAFQVLHGASVHGLTAS
jgi:hypothetical protein